MRNTKWLALLVGLLACGLIAAGCGDDDSTTVRRGHDRGDQRGHLERGHVLGGLRRRQRQRLDRLGGVLQRLQRHRRRHARLRRPPSRSAARPATRSSSAPTRPRPAATSPQPRLRSRSARTRPTRPSSSSSRWAASADPTLNGRGGSGSGRGRPFSCRDVEPDVVELGVRPQAASDRVEELHAQLLREQLGVGAEADAADELARLGRVDGPVEQPALTSSKPDRGEDLLGLLGVGEAMGVEALQVFAERARSADASSIAARTSAMLPAPPHCASIRPPGRSARCSPEEPLVVVDPVEDGVGEDGVDLRVEVDLEQVGVEQRRPLRVEAPRAPPRPSTPSRRRR